MKQFKRVLLPLLTAVIVLGAVLLPGQISNWKDQSLLKRVHRENFSANLDFPSDSLSMGERMKLYARFLQDQDNEGVVVTTQRMMTEELDEVEEVVRQEIKEYAENGYLDENTYQEIIALTLSSEEKKYGDRYFLQDEETRKFARVVVLEAISTTSDLHLWMHIDEETGRILSFAWTLPNLQMQRSIREFGEFFLSRLGVPYECTFENENPNYVEMTLPEQNLLYNFELYGDKWGYYINCRCRPLIFDQNNPEA